MPKSKAIVRRAPSVAKSTYNKLAERSRRTAQRLRNAQQDDVNDAVGLGSAIALGLFEKSGHELPTLFGIDPAITWGVAAYMVGRSSKSKGMQMVRSAGLGLATVGANRSALRGSMTVSGVEIVGGVDDEGDEELL